MALVIIRQDDKIENWKNALLAQAPALEVYSYLEDHPKDRVTMALVWKHPEGSLTEYPNLKVISSFGAGVDFIFKDPTAPRQLPITRVVDPVLAGDMSEFVITQILVHLKNLMHYKVAQINIKWHPQPYRRIADVTVGIMGLGALGAVLADDLVQMGFTVVGWAGSPKPMEMVSVYVGEKQKSEFLSKSEVLVCLLPLTETTTGILNQALFHQLPKGAFVINVARGGHLVDADLIHALDSGQLSGASLDVFHEEPLPAVHPFWKHPKIYMTPHIASVSDSASVVPQLLENYKRMQKGAPLLNVVSPEKGY